MILNWRDAWHPQSGGAELVTLRVAQGLANRGWAVEWFSGEYPGGEPREERDGIVFCRGGTQSTVHVRALAEYRRRSAEFDVVVDEINTIPFYAPLYARAPVVAFFHQLAREVWRYERGGIVGELGYRLERHYLRPYRRTPLITVSHSSAESLRAIGLRGEITVIPESVDEPAVQDPRAVLAARAERGARDVVVLGRVTPSKRVEESIIAARLLVDLGWEGRLFIVGAGSRGYERLLERLSEALGIGHRVVLTGRVSDAVRRENLQRASVLWMTSVREGWGLAVTEAARNATPAIAYNVPGLRDSVVDGRTGRIVPSSPLALARATHALLLDRGLCDRMSLAAWSHSQTMDWDATADAFEGALERVIPG